MPIMKLRDEDGGESIAWMEDPAGVQFVRDFGIRYARRERDGWKLRATGERVDAETAARLDAMPVEQLYTNDGARPWTGDDSQRLTDERMAALRKNSGRDGERH